MPIFTEVSLEKESELRSKPERFADLRSYITPSKVSPASLAEKRLSHDVQLRSVTLIVFSATGGSMVPLPAVEPFSGDGILDDHFLRTYESEQLEFITTHASAVQQRGHVESSKDLYPEIDWSAEFAYGKSSVPLSVLILMYERVALYIPPLPKRDLDRRWGIPFTTILELARARLIQPLIGHPTDYAFEHFTEIFSLKPPSVWARGLGILRALGMEHVLENAQNSLPIGTISEIPWVRARWQRHFPTQNTRELTKTIARELATNVADLHVFGFGRLADAVSHLSDPSQIARALLLFNEVRTYPVLFGLDGVAHYNLSSLQADPTFVREVLRNRTRPPIVVPPELQVLTSGMAVGVSLSDPASIIEFHASSRAKHLRAALRAFEHEARYRDGGLDMGQFFDSAARLQVVVEEAFGELQTLAVQRSIQSTKDRVEWLFRAGGVAVGALLGSALGAPTVQMLSLGSGLGVLIAEKLVPAKWRDALVTRAVAEQFSPGIAHAWRARSKRT